MSEPTVEHADVQPKEEYQPRLNDVAQKFIADLEAERARLEEDFPLCTLVIDEAIERVYSTGRIPGKEYYADVFKQKPIKITQKVFVPVKQYPKFNFTGKILGPKGNSLRRLQDETQCRIVIKGRSSIRDRNREEELRNSGEPKYNHLHKDLYLEISAVSTPAECYARIAYALAEIRKFLIPDKNDDVSHEQLRELLEIDPKSAKHLNVLSHVKKSVLEKKITPGGAGSKYLNLIKPSAYSAQEEHEDEEMEEEESYSYDSRVGKRPILAGYEYSKARPMPSGTAYKRAPAAIYQTDMKRLRENPIKSHKPNAYNIINKYK